MSYIAIQVALMLVMELIIIRSMIKCLTMRSNLLYIALHLSCFTASAIIRVTGTAPFLRTLILPLCYLIFPLALSEGPFRTRLLRISLVVLASLGAEMLGAAIYTLLTGGTVAENTADQSNITLVVAVYSILIPVTTLVLELVIAACRKADSCDDAQLEMPIMLFMLSAVLFFFIIYLRFFHDAETIAPVALSSLAYCLTSIVASLTLLTVARSDARTKREIVDQLAEARQARHVRATVEGATRRSLGMRRLRHDLANQVRVVTGLVGEGHYDDADHYLAALQAQAHELQGKSGGTHE